MSLPGLPHRPRGRVLRGSGAPSPGVLAGRVPVSSPPVASQPAHPDRRTQRDRRHTEGDPALADRGGLVAGRAGPRPARRAGGAGGAEGAARELVGARERACSCGCPGWSPGRSRAPAGPRRGGGAPRGPGCTAARRRRLRLGPRSPGPARRRRAGVSRPAAAAARAAGSPAPRRAAGRRGPWPGTGRRSCHSSSGMPGSGTTVSVTWRRRTAPGCPPPKGVKPASSS